MAVAITNTLVAALDTAQTLTRNAATATAVDTAEAFTYTPTGKPNKTAFTIRNASTANGTLTYAVTKGGNVFQAAANATGSVEAGVTKVVQLQDGRYAGTNDKIVVTLTPASGKSLKSDHAADVAVLELL